ncbi:putative bifunctional diguanylate cyclase/phosphodiesterase [Marinomonas ostreistagni]|uniref:putative bifunctional diguanylate cyclase/phosphodiesterase n=1 Tax=Marinomonas ostreistagni TaxID=359209 RepID=UPI00194FE712|nr:EAL domain-containing protein [Marinomonas ostreistagni]MBM6549820.1 EAL domain-containing protein [Marinomonas ostreistagni]
MRLSIRAKIIAVALISILSSALSVFIISLKEHQSIYSDSVADTLMALTANTADDLLLVLAEQDPFLMRSALLRFERYSHLKYALVLDKKWRTQEAYIHPNYFDRFNERNETLPQISVRTLPFAITQMQDSLYALSPIGEPSNAEGYLLVVHDYNGPLQQSRKVLVQQSIPIIIFILIIALLAMWLIIRQQLHPLINLSAFTRRISASKHYHERFPIKGNDEVYTLAQDINSLLEEINAETQDNIQKNRQLTEQRESMFHLANYDQLTGLPNRRHIITWLTAFLKQAEARTSKTALLYFDIDGFKGVNDRLGHETGDKLLVEIGQLISTLLKPGQVLARLAGDEFLIVLPELKHRSDAMEVARSITELFHTPLYIDRWNIHTGVSIGIAYADEADYELERLISYADVAMYHSKHHSKGQATLFEPKMLLESRRRALIVSSIEEALLTNQFKLYYQPKVSDQGEVNGLEALLRWVHPSLGNISPSEFISIAESCAKISDITRWVIRQTLKDLPQLKQDCSEDVIVSFNVSSSDLSGNWLESFIRDKAESAQLMHHLQFEVTESSYLNDFQNANKFFEYVHNAGASIALDDFGTGFSSLSYLTRINIDSIKIDREFVVNSSKDHRDQVILKTILDLSKEIGLDTCAEGIESASQAKYLILNGCHHLQGFYFSEPVPISQLANAVKRCRRQYQSIDL